MDLVNDMLDMQLVDRNGHAMGRADSVILDVESGRPPRIAAIEIGPSVLGDRLHPRLGRLVRAIERWFRVGANRPVRIAIADVAVEESKLRADVLITETGAWNVEARLRGLLRWK